MFFVEEVERAGLAFHADDGVRRLQSATTRSATVQVLELRWTNFWYITYQYIQCEAPQL